jgi:hypothetical protein
VCDIIYLILPIDGADVIELAIVDGWKVVVTELKVQVFTFLFV